MGFRKGASPELSSFELAAQLEHALVHNTAAVWLQFDLKKRFDMLQWDPLFEIIEKVRRQPESYASQPQSVDKHGTTLLSLPGVH